MVLLYWSKNLITGLRSSLLCYVTGLITLQMNKLVVIGHDYINL